MLMMQDCVSCPECHKGDHTALLDLVHARNPGSADGAAQAITWDGAVVVDVMWSTMSACCNIHEGTAVCVDMGFGHVTFHCWSLGSCVQLSIGLYVQQSCMQVAVETYLGCSAMYKGLHQHSSLYAHFRLLPLHANCMLNTLLRRRFKMGPF